MFKEVVMPNLTNAEDSTESCKPNKVVMRLALAAFAALTFTQSVGCNISRLAVKDAVAVSYRDMVWAKRAYNLRYGNCNRSYPEHFENGFCAGYSDICNGGDGYVPAMPPQDYRSYEFQCAEGAQCVNSWFEGYPAGVAAARKDKVGNFNDVLISRMINSAVAQTESENKLPADIPVVGSDRTAPPSPSVAYQQSIAKPFAFTPPPIMTASANNYVKQAMSVENYDAPMPPIVTGSGAKPGGGSVQSAAWQSNRRSK
jgi:hypothetical protein